MVLASEVQWGRRVRTAGAATGYTEKLQDGMLKFRGIEHRNNIYIYV